MLSDIDTEMKKRGLDAIIIEGDSTIGNPDLIYVVGSALPRGGIYLKKQGEEPVLVVSIIDVGNALKGRVKDIRTYSDYGYEALLSEDPKIALIRLHERLFEKLGVRGAIGMYGRQSASNIIYLTEGLRALGFNVKGEGSPILLDTLRETKNSEEVDRIRNVGIKTQRIVRKVLKFLRECKIRNEVLHYEGRVLKVANVKKMISTLLAEESLIPIGETMFAVGSGSADPHYLGDEGDVVLANQPIIFDIFPQEYDGYCFDCTRTFVIGRASREVRQMYEAVLECQEQALKLLKEGIMANTVMDTVCEKFESRGYKTMRNLLNGDQEAKVRGFIHSLGHGVGLSIGERPNLSLHSKYPLLNGHVTTVEPGIYEPGLGGVRIEDVVVIQNDSALNLTSLEKTLEF